MNLNLASKHKLPTNIVSVLTLLTCSIAISAPFGKEGQPTVRLNAPSVIQQTTELKISQNQSPKNDIKNLRTIKIDQEINGAERLENKRNLSSAMGVKDGGGGNASSVEQALMRSHRIEILNGLILFFKDKTVRGAQKAFAYFAENLKVHLIKNPAVNLQIQTMLSKGLISDIEASPLTIQSQCHVRENNVFVAKSASAVMSAPGTSVCISLVDLIDRLGFRVSDSVMLGLFMHEYAHHFGYMDADYAIAVTIAELVNDEYEMSQTGDREDALIEGFINSAIFQNQNGKMPYWNSTEKCLTGKLNCPGLF